MTKASMVRNEEINQQQAAAIYIYILVVLVLSRSLQIEEVVVETADNEVGYVSFWSYRVCVVVMLMLHDMIA